MGYIDKKIDILSKEYMRKLEEADKIMAKLSKLYEQKTAVYKFHEAQDEAGNLSHKEVS